MKCKVKKILISDFNNLKECQENAKKLKSYKVYLLMNKYRIVHKSECKTALGKSDYIEYFKTLEYGIPIRDF